MKQYVNIRIKTSQKGNKYLSGYHKDTETAYFINKGDGDINSLSKRVGDGGDFQDIGKLEKRTGDYGDYEFVVADGKVFTLSSSRKANEPLTRKDGSAILNDDGQPVLGAPFLLTIKEDQPKEG